MFGSNEFTITNAKGLMEHNKIIQQQAEINVQPVKQTYELQKQTSILEEAKKSSEQNAEYTKQTLEAAITNQKTTEIQFRKTLIISAAALIISILSIHLSIKSSNNTEQLYKQQLKKQDEMINLLKQNKINPVINNKN